MDNWKVEIEAQIRDWADQLDTEPSAAEPSAAEHAPDLYSFFEALCILQSDVRKSTRRSHDTFLRIGETLAGFEEMLTSLAERQAEERQRDCRLAQSERRALLSPFAEMLERLNRLEDRLKRPPDSGRLFARRKWAAAWLSLQQAAALLREHFAQLLRAEGITPMATLGKPFDPTTMKAVAVEESDTLSHNTVIEELATGYYHRGDVLKFAEVKIATRKGTS